MGVASMQWYRDRGLIKRVTKTLTEDSSLTGRKAGESFEYDEVIQGYSCGRMWTMDQLVEMYERNNPKIEWWTDD
jgi:hypothetical protein